jgi:hypothetical protein
MASRLHQSSCDAIYRPQQIDYKVDWHLQGWANINRLGDYHNLHNHPHCWLSGTYYVSVSESPVDLPGRADRTPGAISFFDPRGQANMTAIKAGGSRISGTAPCGRDPALARFCPSPGAPESFRGISDLGFL